MLDPLIALADTLRRDGFDVSASELIDATHAICAIDLGDREGLRHALRATMVKRADRAGRFDLAFDRLFHESVAPERGGGSGDTSGAPRAGTAGGGGGLAMPSAGSLDEDILRALMSGDHDALTALAAQAVRAYAGLDAADGSERYHLHRVRRGIDLSRMLSAAMQRLRADGEATDLELMIRRNEISALLDDFRRRLAIEIAGQLRDRPSDGGVTIPERVDPQDLDLLALSHAELEQVRLALQPLLRRLANTIGGRRRRRRRGGRLDVRRTVRHSLQYGGVPIEIVQRRKHPRRPEVVVLCDVSGSVAEFAQFTFTIINALHREVRDVRSFAFVDGVAEVSDVFAGARYEIAVNRLVERRGVIGLDGHSDYGSVFARFRVTHLDEAIGPNTTLIITGDARGNYRDAGLRDFEIIAARARRVYWLNPEREQLWGENDSLIEDYRQMCTAVHEVRSLGQLAGVIAELV